MAAGPGERNVRKVLAEMGGKNALIVDGTADLDEAVKGVRDSAFGYQGQKCSACSRVILTEDIYEEFVERFREACLSIRLAPAGDPGSFMGPVVDEGAFRKIKGYIETGKKEGKTVLVREASGEDYLIGPVVFGEVSPQARIAQEEIFGPVIALMKARDIDEAIDLANSTHFALTGGLFSRSPANISKVKEGFRVGNLYINRKITGALVGRQPFGGFGMSGTGSKAGGPDYLLHFMNPVSISENTMRRGFAPLP
jgi:RHH-type proline utilization regulon transcriptional repressor/proline dehydrogenase/delta 1-pyrroline-5-carboxylate dehydrogenase